ncbi:hypothetical protein, variant 1 [Exophiala mesophila]|uniref:PLD phosphodiesterase domain-containing protein n=1 Tax=Exophiala mesophila TaxID=212818 RepID=A0A0D1ZR11_EXOME|nr:hypothetical protein, variant 1 [Exophiala mesophila]KIV89228.1 hypothetical protein, variant 1 [Exophiala mesophila]
MIPANSRSDLCVWTASLISIFRLNSQVSPSLKHLPHPLSQSHIRPSVHESVRLAFPAGSTREHHSTSHPSFLDSQANLTFKAQSLTQKSRRLTRLKPRLVDCHIRPRRVTTYSSNHVDLILEPIMPPTHSSQGFVDLTADYEAAIDLDLDSVDSPTSETRSTPDVVITATNESPTGRPHPQSSGSGTSDAILLLDDDDDYSLPESPVYAPSGLASDQTTIRNRSIGDTNTPVFLGRGETMYSRCSIIGAVKDGIARKANRAKNIEEAKDICFKEIMCLKGGGPTDLGKKWAGSETRKQQDGQVQDNPTRPVSSNDNTNTVGIPIRQSLRKENILNLDSDEDEDLRRAIALSLETPNNPTSDHEKSGSPPQRSQDTVRNNVTQTLTMSNTNVAGDGLNPGALSTSATTFNLQTLNRHQMEQERQARLKRKRTDQQPGDSSLDARRRDITSENGQHNSRTASPASVSPPPVRRRLTAGGVAATQLMSIDTSSSNLRHSLEASRDSFYPAGRVLQTYIAGFPSTNTISFSQVVGPKESLTSCLLSSFIWDFDWLLPHFATTRTKFQLVMHAKTPPQREALRQDFEGVPNVRLCFPPMDGLVNCMHSKLMLLFYDADDMDGQQTTEPCSGTSWAGPRCRVVVPTANLTSTDWGVGGVMENTAFIIDLPMIRACQQDHVKNGNNATRPDLYGKHDQTAFHRSLSSFLRAQMVPEDVIDKLGRFDFTKTEQLGFVHTVGGAHTGRQWRDTGVCGLGRTVKELGLGTDENIQVDIVASSMGSLNNDFVASLYFAAQGDDGMKGYLQRTTKTSVAVGRSSTVGRGWHSNLRLYFPSDTTVRASKGGPGCAGTICTSQKWFDGSQFPRDLVRDCISSRAGLLMHNKMIFVRFPSPVDTGKNVKIRGWAYVGSANASESAWGQLVQDRNGKSLKLNCRNWECGVIVPVSAENEEMSGEHEQVVDEGKDSLRAVFGGTVPVPMRYPTGLVAQDGGRPWFFSGFSRH